MNNNKKTAFISLIGLILVSCSGRGGTEHTVISSAESGVDSGSDTMDETSTGTVQSGSNDSTVYSSSSKVSLLSSTDSSGSTSIPSSNTVYYTVSIYQSYLIPDKGVYGNPRFDTSVKAEAKKPLYTTSEEMQDLEGRCRESYHPNGGMYSKVCFFTDETCQTFISTSTIVNSDMCIYYYCVG